MDLGNTSRERRRLSRGINVEAAADNSFEKIIHRAKNPSSTPIKSRPSSSANVRAPDRSRQQLSARIHRQNDSTDEEATDEPASPAKHIVRRGSTSPKGTDEDSSADDHVSGKVSASLGAVHQRERRRKSKRKRLRSEEKRISSTRKDDEENADEDRASLKRLGSTRRDYSDGSRRAAREKKDRRGRGDHRNELPITEILRKAQNSRSQYEEPVPLPQLTTDTIYVQGRNGFSAVKIPSERITRGHQDTESGATVMYPIKVAILAQKAWKNAGLIYQGLLAGMALMHFLVMQNYVKIFEQFILDFSVLMEIYTNIFSFLVAMCIVAAFDKFDLAHFNYDHFREIYLNHAKSILAIPLYIVAFCLHQSTAKVDDKLALLHYNCTSNQTMFETDEKTVSTAELNSWQTITLIKDSLVVLAWLFISLGPQNDLLLSHLEEMERYAESNCA